MHGSTPVPGSGTPSGTLRESVTIAIIKDGVASEHTADLTGVPRDDALCHDADLAALTHTLEPLRAWLQTHGALSPGSGLLVRSIPAHLRPEDAADEHARPGTVLDVREVAITLRDPRAGQG